MEQQTGSMELLDFIDRPGFCVRNGIIVRVNPAAEAHMICPGETIQDRLMTGAQEYGELDGGRLYLTLNVGDHPYGASVVRMKDFDLFILEQSADQAELQVMALVAKELRGPLSSVMTVADQLFPQIARQEDHISQAQISRINRGLFQMLRIISNMSDANRYSQENANNQITMDVCSVFEEVFEKTQTLIHDSGLSFSFTNYPEPVYCLADAEKLERAAYNMLSNAIKFTPKGGSVSARITKRNNRLYFTVQDTGCGIPEALRGNVYSRYLRQPGLEDGRFGIGLGMVLIRSAAASHGGTVLMEFPPEGGLRITMTIALRQKEGGTLRSNILQIDYAGERDHGLIELSETLPAQLYESDRIN